MSDAPLNRKMIDAMNALVDADERLHQAKEALARARRDECSATNAANEAQRNFDAVATEIRKLALPGTDWKTQKQEQAHV